MISPRANDCKCEWMYAYSNMFSVYAVFVVIKSQHSQKIIEMCRNVNCIKRIN